MSEDNQRWIPEIMYEESPEETGVSSHIPFIPVPQDEEMPNILFIFESRETGEFEPGPSGEELPVTNFELHQYADMAILKEKLDPLLFDIVRSTLGLEPLKVAAAKGKEITDKVRSNMTTE
jgi:hypothetical protein